jgi:hypothetical protein
MERAGADVSQDDGRDEDKRGRDGPRRSSEECNRNDRFGKAGDHQSNPMRFFETSRATRKPSHLDKAWEKVHVVCTAMQEKATGRTPAHDELRAAEVNVKAILKQHFPEGPKGPRVRTASSSGGLTTASARQRRGRHAGPAAFREIGRLERDPAKPNYLAEVSPVDGIDFARVGRGLYVRDRAAAHAKAKI